MAQFKEGRNNLQTRHFQSFVGTLAVIEKPPPSAFWVEN
jgi:hypothetical protein